MSRFYGLAWLLGAMLLPLPLAQDAPAQQDGQPYLLAQAEQPSLLERPARLRVANVPLTEALSELQARSATRIVFSPSLLPAGVTVSCDCRGSTVRQGLDWMLHGLPLGYAVVGDYIVIERKAEGLGSAAGRPLASGEPAPSVLLAALPAREADALREVRGTIVDRLTGLPIRGASVELEPAGREAMTGPDGAFRMQEVLGVGATLRVTRPGYRDQAVRVGSEGGEFEVALRATLFSTQEGTIAGTVTDRETGEPLETVEIIVDGTNRSTTTGANGRYILRDVARGTHTILARRIGYATARQENVRVPAGGTAEVDFQLRTQALSLEEVIVTGVTDPTAGVKVPFSVGKLTEEDLHVPTTASAIANIQGKIPGVHIVRPTGQPGSGVFIQLRSPTSMVRSNTPMFVVDGVVLGSDVSGTTVDIESLDIESMEIVKGAAAAALYGSRAAAGVISITTRSGSSVPMNTTRITARTEYGLSDVPAGVPLANTHFYEMNDAGQFVDGAGDPTEDPTDWVIKDDHMMDNPYPGPLHNNLDRFFQPGVFMTNSVSLGQNTGSTNFLVSVNNYEEKGTIVTNEGYERTNFRANIDHRLNDDLTLGARVYHNRSTRDDISGGLSGEGSVFWDMMMFPPNIDLGVRDDDGNFVQQPHPLINRENPIWRQTSRDNSTDRMRTLLSAQSRFSPLSWLSLDGNISYDRSDQTRTIYVPKGTPFVTTSDDDQSTGRLDQREDFTDAINATVGANFLWNFGALTTRASARGLIERERRTRMGADARDFWVEGVRDLDVAQRMQTYGFEREVRSNGYTGTLGLDYAGKYIADFLVRRDGSSLFGPDARWANYYRVSGAYRMSEEEWWPVEELGEFKLRFSQGTSGGRPSFSDQYETWSVSSSGSVSKGTLGNRNLRPEHTTEREFGMDMIFLDRFQLELTYATQETTDQIVQIPQPAVTGYSNQWQNSGTIEGHTYEAALQANLINTRNLQWGSTLIADRTRSEFTEWNRVCYIPSAGYVYRCLGSNHTEFYGERFLTSMNELPEWHAGSAAQFAVNDDGYLVAVGDGSLGDARWGEVVEIDGVRYDWGHPVMDRDENGNPVQQIIGEGFPDFTLGWQNQVRWGNFRFYTHMNAQVGGQIYNRTRQRLYQHNRHAELDQSGVPAELKKPFEYYQTLYEQNNINSHFVEDGGFVKLRELSARYTLEGDLLSTLRLDRFGTDRITFGLIGRNLLTFTDYSGFDPEVGSNAFIRRDNFNWPNTRTITGMVEVQF